MKSSTRIRLTLAEGHWTLGEHDQAIESLRLAFEAEPDEAAIEALVDRFLSDVDEGSAPPKLRTALEGMMQRAEPMSTPAVDPGPALATSTMAELLEQQGHTKKALEVAERALARYPGDGRALAVKNRLSPGPRPHERQIAVLESWLDYFRPRGREEAQV